MDNRFVLLNESLTVSERYRVELRAYVVKENRKYPEDVKARYVLVDVIEGKPRILVDNHAPFGFHAHTRLPEEKDYRASLETNDYREALEIFRRMVKEVLDLEN